LTEVLNRLLLRGQDITDVLISLCIAAFTGMLISQIYRSTHRGLNYEHTFMASLVLFPPIVTLVMLYIRGDLVLSLGLVGSLSIIRFRTVIKDTRDMVFLFWVIAIGLGAGTYNWGVVLISTLFIMIIVAVLYFIRYGHNPNRDFVLSISGQLPHADTETVEVLKRHTEEARMRSYEVEEDRWEIIYELRLLDQSSQAADSLIQELKAMPGINNVSLLAPQLSLPL
jgi:hypothetical protein